jgi:small subunit ribosomal protein S33
MPFRLLTPALKAIVATSSARIFGNLPVVNHRTGMKLLRRKPIGPLMNDWYMKTMGGKVFRRTVDPQYMTEQEDRHASALALLKLRGKGPPKKGHGKRASKAKKGAAKKEKVAAK